MGRQGVFRVRQGGDGHREAAPTVLCFGDEERNKCDVEGLPPPRHI